MFYVSLELDSLDRPCIAYYQDYPESNLKYARWTGTEWIIETVDSEGYVGVYCSLALDSSDRPCIAYADAHDGDSSDLKYARWDGDEWLYEYVDTGGDTCVYISLALDSYDRPHISYQKKDDVDDLRYAHWDGSRWLVETVDAAEGNAGAFSSIAVDSQDRPHIAYKYANFAKYAYKDGSGWHIITVDAEEGIRSMGFTSIALDSTDLPYILDYQRAEIFESPRCSHWDGERWRSEYADPYNISFRSSIGVDSHDQPHISYIGRGAGRSGIGIKYAWCEIFFHLLSPGRGKVVTTLTPTLDWTDDDNPDLASYTLWWGTDPDFVTYNEVTDIGESEYTIPSGIEDGERIYWRVKSLDDQGGEYWAEEIDWYFDVDLSLTPVYHLLSPEKGEVVYAFPFTFDWEDHDLEGLESYTLWWGTDPDFETYNEVTDIVESEYTLSGGIEDGARVYWRVKSLDDEGGEYWAEELDWYFDVDLGGGVNLADFGAGATDEGVLINWRLSGEEPAGVRVLRGEGEPEIISGVLPGDSSRYLDRGVEPGESYAYWLEVVEADGSVSRFGPTEAIAVPEETFTLVLYAAYPSPSRDVVNFVYSLPVDGRVVLTVYDLSGRRVATLVDSELTAGRHEVAWSCADVPSGVYLYRLETNAGSLTQRLVVSR
ncbi:MAG: T9SS type A sorting domain-containing protein [bacterium]|nr:T9SS type A sorting domain-containing protein [bacterium]